MTNGELREVTKSSSETESDSETVVMFNLDRINDDHLVSLHGATWEQGQIPKSTKGLIDSLVSRVVEIDCRQNLEVRVMGLVFVSQMSWPNPKTQPNP